MNKQPINQFKPVQQSKQLMLKAYYCPNIYCVFEGFKLLVHDPSAYPELQSKALAIGSGQEVFVTTNAAHTDA